MEDYQIAGLLTALAVCAGCFREFWKAFGGPDLCPRPERPAPSPIIDTELYGPPVEIDSPLPFPDLQDGDDREMAESHSGKVVVAQSEAEAAILPQHATDSLGWIIPNPANGKARLVEPMVWEGFKGTRVNVND